MHASRHGVDSPPVHNLNPVQVGPSPFLDPPAGPTGGRTSASRTSKLQNARNGDATNLDMLPINGQTSDILTEHIVGKL